MRLLKFGQVALVALTLAACTAAPTPPARSATSAPIASPPPSRSASPSPPPVIYLDPSQLPSASLATEGATLVCDPDPAQVSTGAASSNVICYDALALALRAFHTVVPAVDRLYLQRPSCPASPCPSPQLDLATVLAWSGSQALAVTVDGAHDRVSAPTPDMAAQWPDASGSPPTTLRPSIAGAPTSVRNRPPFPFCGDATVVGSSAYACFLDQVLEGRPAELLDRFAVSGGVEVLRFDGQGLIERFAEWPDGWFQDGGSVILGPTAATWSLDNWVERQRVTG